MQVSCTTIEEMVLQLAELDNPPHRTGASPAAIISHYDMGEEFFQLVLDPDLVYSCALFEAGDSLWDAQRRKHDHHIQASGGCRQECGGNWRSAGSENLNIACQAARSIG